MDRKIETFLTLCRTMNYRIAAEKLHLTQPAVTKQIQSLEAEYGIKLFIYDGRKLYKTPKCEILETYAQSLEYNYSQMRTSMLKMDRIHLRIGATKTIGDYVIGPSVMKYLENPMHELSLTVDNTEQLLTGLDENRLDFAFIEGRFDKRKYEYRLFRVEPFMGIRKAGVHHKERNVKESIESLLSETIIIREKGSGTREIFERDLNSYGYSLDSFSRVIELSSFRLIVEAVKGGIGISFLYGAVVDLVDGIEMFTVDKIETEHEFNIVSLKNTLSPKYIDMFLGIIS